MVLSIGKTDSDSIIVESHTIDLACWGELLASKLKATHLVFLLHEEFNVLPNDLYKYFEFKHFQRRLAGITKRSLIELFEPYKQLQEIESFSLHAICYAPVLNVGNNILDSLKKHDINLGCITRLENICTNNG